MDESIDAPSNIALGDGSDFLSHGSGSEIVTSDEEILLRIETFLNSALNPLDSNNVWTKNSSNYIWMAQYIYYASMSNISNLDWIISSNDGNHEIFENRMMLSISWDCMRLMMSLICSFYGNVILMSIDCFKKPLR